MNNDTAIKVEHITKAFKLPHEKNNSLKSALVNFRKRGYERQTVLKNISFEIKKGEFFGIVGRNGSGKSTLLKLISGIYTQDKGTIQVNGRLTPFIELGVGFNQELSGRDNVYLNGALLGFSRKEVDEMYDSIVEFAELSRFMDQKLKNYSSGMQVRLAFSIAIRANTDILVLDEVLAVGDSDFQKKCFEYFSKVKNDNKTLVLVTHDMGVAKKYCDRSILIEKGDIISEGSTDKVVSDYNNLNLARAKKGIEKRNREGVISTSSSNSPLSIKGINSTDTAGKIKTIFNPREMISINIDIAANKVIENPILILSINNPGGPHIMTVNSSKKKLKFSTKVGKKTTIQWKFENVFNDGSYLVNISIYDAKAETMYDQANESYKFEVRGWPDPFGIVHIEDELKEV